MLNPKKKVLDEARERGVIERMNVLLSIAYLLMSDASLFVAETDLLLERNGLKIGEVKHFFNQLQVAFDRFTINLSAVFKEGAIKDWARDVDTLDEIIHVWQCIPKTWDWNEPQYIEDAKQIAFNCRHIDETGKKKTNTNKDD